MSDLEVRKPEEMVDFLANAAHEKFETKINSMANPGLALEFEKVIILKAVDARWTDHIDAMDQLRQGVGLRAYAQNNPLVEYQTEGFDRFNEMIAGIDHDETRMFMKAEIRQNLQRQQV